ncbi:branched-chain amino acid ABC transporter permease [Catenulispora sp. NF23]|uniref:Branched-chain amino acid ABC transporter permease n=1 Tax=Catenulispora pinistramenti TaxID=2705254 RepID=A0ABS5KHI6_9ACTN|nr:branched-chain amino acid ABC transporter permease [Catenulispora pinistramenti]MBS2536347.1 branched-chain amino acid ABC transporter permease [Catenulispora pinistramenti]MBS2545823.1 branched-chain amino acid ABC transporter permease [Catenulispora pinistramenti]
MSTLVLLTLTGLGLGALYFLIASGLSLIFGLMDVLNFAHGALVTAGAYAAWRLTGHLPFAVAIAAAIATGAALAALIETVLIRPLYSRPKDQILVTVGLGLALPALVQGIWGADARQLQAPKQLAGTVSLLGARVPTDRFVLIAAAIVVLAALKLFLSRTRYGLVVRAGVEDRAMVTALGIDVRKAFTLVFAIGGALAGLAGALGGVYFGSVSPDQGTSLLVFGFVVVVIGGMGRTDGVALAAAAVGLIQQFTNYYAASGLGDFAAVAILAVVLLARGNRDGVRRLIRRAA